jgi:hypothetical protein
MALEVLSIVTVMLGSDATWAQSKAPFPDLPSSINSPRDAMKQLEPRQPSSIRTINFQQDGTNQRNNDSAQSGSRNNPFQDSNQNQSFTIRLDPPGPEVLFRLESEKEMFERIKQEFKNRPSNAAIEIPKKPELTSAKYTPRMSPQQAVYREPRHVTYHRLHFEEKNAERFGWDLGIVQPIVSAAYFYKDVLFLPHAIGSYPFRRYENSAGYCLPGDPVPYTLYPPEFTVTGSALETGVVLGLLSVFP